MSLKRLWAPWRMEYVQAPKKEEGCIFCKKQESDNQGEHLVVYKGKAAFVLMNLYPYNNGHILIAPYEHVSDLTALNAETLTEMMDLVTQGMEIMRRSMNAQGFNFGANIGTAAGAGIEDHVHLHLVPRWAGDTNFMPVLGETKVQVQSLAKTRDVLATEFESMNP